VSEWEPEEFTLAAAAVSAGAPAVRVAAGGVVGEGGEGGLLDSADDDFERGGGRDSSDSKAANIHNDFDAEAQEGWVAGQSVPFAFLAATLDRVQATSKRLEIAGALVWGEVGGEGQMHFVSMCVLECLFGQVPLQQIETARRCIRIPFRCLLVAVLPPLVCF